MGPQSYSRNKTNTGAPAVRIPRNTPMVPTIRMADIPLFNARSKHKSLPYYTNNTLSIPAGASTSYVFSANGMYDPDISGTGAQPRGFDQMMIFYEHYTVSRCHIEVSFRNYTASVAPTVYIAARADTANVPSPTDLMEQGNSVSVQIQPIGEGSLQKLSMVVDVARFLGFDDLMDSNVARGDLTSNPAEQVYFHVGAFNNETLASGTVQFQVRLRYLAVFTEARTITPSLSSSFRRLLIDESENKSDSRHHIREDPLHVVRNVREGVDDSLDVVVGAECFHRGCGTVCAHRVVSSTCSSS
jgi:hypothetical protein